MASIYRRGKAWWGKVQRNGKVLRRSLKTETKGVARDRLRTWLDQLDAIAWGEKPRHTFDDAAEKFISEHCRTLKPSSTKRYHLSLTALGGILEGLMLDQITSAKLSEFEQARREKGVSSPSIRRDLACLSSMFGCCMEWEWSTVNPVPAYFRSRRKRGLREAQPRTRYLSLEEEAKLIEASSGLRQSAIIFAIETGLRREEQFSLTWPQVDLTAKEIRLSGMTKSGKPRRVPLTERAIAALPPQHIRSMYVFRHDDGSRVVQFAKGLKQDCRRAAIAMIRWHDLRRTCGCRLLQDKKLSMEAVALWLGHSSILVTEKTYAFLEYEHMRDALDAGTRTDTGNARN